MPKCVILVGMPGCGKSTVRERYNLPAISSDDYIEKYALHNGLTYIQAIDMCLSDARKNNDTRFKQFVDGCESFIIDRTNLSLTKRSEIYDKLPSIYSIEIVVVSKSIVDQSITNMFRTLKGRNVPQYEIDELRSQYVKPSFDEDRRIKKIEFVYH